MPESSVVQKGDTFGEDSDEEDVLIPPNESETSDSDTDIGSDIEDFRRVSIPTVVTATVNRNTGSSISDGVVKPSVHSDKVNAVGFGNRI